MIVCLCQRISDRDIRAAVEQGTTNFERLQDQTGVASRCGRCMDCARATFHEACEQRAHRGGHAGCGGCHPLPQAA